MSSTKEITKAAQAALDRAADRKAVRRAEGPQPSATVMLPEARPALRPLPGRECLWVHPTTGDPCAFARIMDSRTGQPIPGVEMCGLHYQDPRLEQSVVHYRPADPPRPSCQDCSHWAGATGQCHLVRDPISPEGWCDLFDAAAVPTRDELRRLRFFALEHSEFWETTEAEALTFDLFLREQSRDERGRFGSGSSEAAAPSISPGREGSTAKESAFYQNEEGESQVHVTGDPWTAYNVPPEEQAGLKLYASPRTGPAINAALRSGSDLHQVDDGFGNSLNGQYGAQDAQTAVDAMDHLVAATTLSRDATLYRGVTGGAFPTEVGTRFTDNGFSSTTASEDVAQHFADNTFGTSKTAEDPLVVEITAPAGTNVGMMGSVSGPNLQEVVLGRGTTYEVTGNKPSEYSDVPRVQVRVVS